MRKALILTIVACLAFAATLQAQQAVPVGVPAGVSAGVPVSLSLIVTDKQNKSVNTIYKDQIHVFEDKVEQPITAIEPDERPVDYGIVIDASGSFRRLIVSSLETVRLIIKNKRPADEVFIERFISSLQIEKHQDFTSDEAVLLKSLENFKIEGGQSAVIDALYMAVNYVDEHNKANAGRRKVVIIITDGEDRNSSYKQEELVNLLHETGVQVFVLGLVIELEKEPGFIRRSPQEKAEKLLKTVAEESGGRIFFPKDKQQLIDSTTQIIMDLRGQFRINYQSTSDASKKGFRKVDVKFVSTDAEKLSLVVPRGYFVGPRTALTTTSEKKP